MALHFQTLRTFFKLLYPELNSIQIAYLEEVLEELYGKFNITWNTDITGIPNNKFPIMTDLYNLLEEKTMLVCDEAYLLIDPEVPQSLIFLRNVAKRCRKYEGSLIIISHSIVDFLDSSVKMYGQAILDMATYKILMGTDNFFKC